MLTPESFKKLFVRGGDLALRGANPDAAALDYAHLETYLDPELFRDVHYLYLINVELPDLAPLSVLPSVLAANLTGLPIVSLEPLRRSQLGSVHIENCPNLDSCEPLFGLPLRGFGCVGNPRITDFSFLPQLSRVTLMTLGGPQVDDTVLDILESSGAFTREDDRLNNLTLKHTSVTRARFDALQDAHPQLNCELN
jgi:hypothetical protein